MTQERYFGSFSGFDQMLAEWGSIAESEIVPASDEDVIFASYGTEGYEGHAIVIFRRDGKLYEVNGSHCSCHGLSEESYYSGGGSSQWAAEETSAEALSLRDPYLDLDEEAASAIIAWKGMVSSLAAVHPTIH